MTKDSIHRQRQGGAPSPSAADAYRPRVLYFSVFSWVFLSGGRFLAPFLEHACHLSASQIGVALALQQAVQAVLGSIAGAYADARERQRPGRGRAECLATGVVVGTLLFTSHAVLLGRTSSTTATVVYDTLLQVGYAMAVSFVFPVLDGMTLQHLESSGSDSADYGKERLFGAVSWALSAMVVAPLLDVFGFSALYPATLLSGVGVLGALYLYVRSHCSPSTKMFAYSKRRNSDIILADDDDDTTIETDIEETTMNSSTDGDDDIVEARKATSGDSSSNSTNKIPLYRLLWTVLGNIYGFAFALAVLTLASGQAIVESLVFLFFEWLGSSYGMMGLTVGLTVAFEIPIFHIAPQLLERWGSGRLLILAGLCYATRVVGYSLVPQNQIVWVLFLEPLHGITYACSATATVDFVARYMPDGYEASGQGLVGLLRGVGSVLGVWVGGWAHDALGPRVMYRGSALTVALGLLVFGIVSWWLPPPNQQHEHMSVSQTEDQELELAPTVAKVSVQSSSSDDSGDSSSVTEDTMDLEEHFS